MRPQPFPPFFLFCCFFLPFFGFVFFGGKGKGGIEVWLSLPFRRMPAKRHPSKVGLPIPYQDLIIHINAFGCADPHSAVALRSARKCRV